MKNCFTALFLTFLFAQLHAQQVNFQWAMSVGSTGMDGTYSVATDAAGNVYSVGEFKGNVDFDPGPGTYFMNSGSSNLSNSFILKLSPAGNFIWAKQVQQLTAGNNLAGNIFIDAAGAIYYSAQLFGILDADPGPAVFPLGNAASSGESFLTKLDAAGNFVWAKILASNNTGIADFNIDQSGNVYATGFFQGTVDFDPGAGTYPLTSNGLTDIFVLKLDMNGVFLWAGGIGSGANDYGYGLEINSSGEVFCTGTFAGTADFDPGPGNYNLSTQGLTSFNTYILKLNSNGGFIWAKQIVSTTSNSGWGLTVDINNNILITGTLSGMADFDPGPGISNYSAAGGNDIYILKLNSNGDFIWAGQIGGLGSDGGNSVVCDQTGSIYITGHFSQGVDFDPGSGSMILASWSGSDVFILKLDPSANFSWVRQIIGNGSGDYGIDIFVDAAYNVYATGIFDGVADFDLGTGVYLMTPNGLRDGYLLKLARCTNITTSTLNITACDTYTLNGQTYNATGTYMQTVLNSNGCDSIITLNLTIGRKFTSINATICEGQSYYAGGANQIIAGIYKDTLLTSLGCDSIVTTTLIVNPKPKPDLGPDRNLCVSATATITPGVFNTYLWQDNSTQPSLLVSNPGTYWVTVTTIGNNCTATDTLRILAIDTIPVNFLPANQNICYGNEVKISVPGYKDYLWSTGSTLPDISLTSFGTFYLTVKDFNDCTGTDTIIIQRANCIFIGIPNAFTPNGDGLNDVFKPTINQAIRSYSFMVFNRYGEKIFGTNEYGTGWDGTYKGKQQNSGSYVYRITFINIFGWESVNNGSVLLIR